MATKKPEPFAWENPDPQWCPECKAETLHKRVSLSPPKYATTPSGVEYRYTESRWACLGCRERNPPSDA